MLGYSLQLAKANQEASAKHPGVKLGRICIKHNVPVAQVAKYCGVTRATVYSWFKGETNPSEEHLPKMIKLAESLEV